LVEAIWDTVAEDATLDQLPVSEAHRAELDRRLEDLHARPDAQSRWHEVRERLKRG
jgi:putative addiction module component (TIGR02574 family)